MVALSPVYSSDANGIVVQLSSLSWSSPLTNHFRPKLDLKARCVKRIKEGSVNIAPIQFLWLTVCAFVSQSQMIKWARIAITYAQTLSQTLWTKRCWYVPARHGKMDAYWPNSVRRWLQSNWSVRALYEMYVPSQMISELHCSGEHPGE